MNEEKLAEQFKKYQKLGEQDKKIDVAKLMLEALQHQESNQIPIKQKRWAYLIALSLAPVGLIFAGKFYLSDKDDGQQVAIICVVLTIFSILIYWLIGKAIFSSSGLSLNQIQQTNPNDLRQLLR